MDNINHTETHAITGAFGYSGSYIAKNLLEQGKNVVTLTNNPGNHHELKNKIQIHPLDFNNKKQLAQSLQNIRVLYNTYWVRFNHRNFNHQQAVVNTQTLFDAARTAGVQRIIHVSITNPSLDSPYSYFRGKAQLEQSLISSGMQYAIIRPAVLFGGRDILINNIAWLLKHSPLFAIFGNGQYKLQPIHVEDQAKLAVQLGNQTTNTITDAIGPETFTYEQLVKVLIHILNIKRKIIHISPRTGLALSKIFNLITRDVVITRDEIGGLMDNLLVTQSQPTGSTRLTDWAQEHHQTLGKNYQSELARRK
ncbi:SDR family oxidoreductase [Poriferisphaera sp. WC338]|uniref:SDR family oxidoreductase n=1 Tax=Poriferisphaera sp. WC338 TaxID=3425129 RepID=UPI003D814E47